MLDPFGRVSSATVLAFVLLVLLFSSVASAQLGEVAGKVNFNMVVGRNGTLYMQIFDSSNSTPVNFSIIKPQFQPVSGQPTPTISVSPLNGTLLPAQSLSIGITVHMPSNATVGTTWSGVVQVVEVVNQSSSGATAQTGVAKVITATAFPIPTTTLPPQATSPQQSSQSQSQTQLQLPTTLLGGVALIILIGCGAVYYYLKVMKKKGRSKTVEKSKRAMVSGKREPTVRRTTTRKTTSTARRSRRR